MPRSEEREGQIHVPTRHRPSQQVENSLRKRLISPIRQVAPRLEHRWLELDKQPRSK
jgi:hypothetical protein